jgi:protein-disulfide isomerase
MRIMNFSVTPWLRAGLPLLALVVVGGVGACAKDGAAKTSASATAPAAESSVSTPDTMASIGDQAITMQDVRDRIGPALERLDVQYQRARSQMLDSALHSVLSERVLALASKKEGKSVDEMLAAEVGSLEPTDVEVSTWYQENQLRLGGRSIDQLRPQILDFLRKQKRREAAEKLQDRLTNDLKVTVNFELYRPTFDNTGAPTLGNKDAAVTLVEFSDFQCPFCKGFAPTLHQVAKEFGDKVLVVYRQYPIVSLHPNAPKAAEASLCANEQGKFWELHDVMFNEQDRLDVSSLKEKARRLGMNQKNFDSCLDSGKYVEQVQRDQAEGMKLGIAGTPAVFLNGIELKGGAVSFETVRTAIQSELKRLGKN